MYRRICTSNIVIISQERSASVSSVINQSCIKFSLIVTVVSIALYFWLINPIKLGTIPNNCVEAVKYLCKYNNKINKKLKYLNNNKKVLLYFDRKMFSM